MKMTDYFETESQRELITKAIEYATKKHEGQKRKCGGEDYIVHPINVGLLLAETGQPLNVVLAGILHDVVEDTDAELADVAAIFKQKVAHYVWGVTDISKPVDGNRVVRKAMDLVHNAHSCSESQSIKYADIIDNCKNLDKCKDGFARMYLEEKLQVLKACTKGDAFLRDVAIKTVKDKLSVIKD